MGKLSLYCHFCATSGSEKACRQILMARPPPGGAIQSELRARVRLDFFHPILLPTKSTASGKKPTTNNEVASTYENGGTFSLFGTFSSFNQRKAHLSRFPFSCLLRPPVSFLTVHDRQSCCEKNRRHCYKNANKCATERKYPSLPFVPCDITWFAGRVAQHFRLGFWPRRRCAVRVLLNDKCWARRYPTFLW